MTAIGEHNLARLAERSFERKGDYEALLFEGHWHRSGELERARRLAAGLSGARGRPRGAGRRDDGQLARGRDRLQRDLAGRRGGHAGQFLLPPRTSGTC